MITIEQAVTAFGVRVDEYLDRQATIPVHDGLQFQGDVAVIPADAGVSGTPVPVGGYPVVRGESGGNTHLLIGDGPIFFSPSGDGGALSLDLGQLTVPVGSVAYLAHPEHGYSGIAPGTYTLLRQREQADIIRMVAD